MNFPYKKANRGNAAILFVMIVPVLFGVFTLGSDGTRALQDKARLNEAIEVASLAVSAQGSDDEAVSKQTAKRFISYYFPHATVVDKDISVTKIICEPGSNKSGCSSSITERYFDYGVTASISLNSWFPGNSTIVGMGKTYDLASGSSVKKFQSETIDIVYVSDFSWSMVDPLLSAEDDDVGLSKYQILVNIIEDVNDEVKRFNDKTMSTSHTKSRVGFTAFNDYIHGEKLNPPGICNSDNWLYLTNKKSGGVDNLKTVSEKHLFQDQPECETGTGESATVYGTFNDIALTDDFGTESSAFEAEINTFFPGGKTNSTQGIIQGARIANRGENPRRLVIILSDGKDFPDWRKVVTADLVNHGLCDNIRDHLDNQLTTDGHSVKSRIVFIGFDIAPETNPALITCVGGSDSGNVFQANSGSALKSIILSLITEEIGHLAN